MHAYCPFYFSYIITVVIRFLRSSHMRDLLISHPLCVFPLVVGFARISGSSPGPFGGSCPLCPFPLPPWRRWWRSYSLTHSLTAVVLMQWKEVASRWQWTFLTMVGSAWQRVCLELWRSVYTRPSSMRPHGTSLDVALTLSAPFRRNWRAWPWHSTSLR